MLLEVYFIVGYWVILLGTERVSSGVEETSSIDFVLAFSIELDGVKVAVEGVTSELLPDMPVEVIEAVFVPEPPYRGRSHSCCLSTKNDVIKSQIIPLLNL